MLKLNEIYEWEEIVKEYPDMWAFITDIIENDDGSPNTCRLLAICKFEETSKYLHEFLEKGVKFECERTTFSAPNVGFLC